ncbi:MAG: hypothetical protein MK110_14285 [Fuerstiella sp.]|nr:hypothetical protein [Fuerstiella sp.]
MTPPPAMRHRDDVAKISRRDQKVNWLVSKARETQYSDTQIQLPASETSTWSPPKHLSAATRRLCFVEISMQTVPWPSAPPTFECV